MLVHLLFAWILGEQADCSLSLYVLLASAIKQLFEALADILRSYRCCDSPYVCTGSS